jgi:hypothetical protein
MYGPPAAETHAAARSWPPDPTVPTTTVLVRHTAAEAAWLCVDRLVRVVGTQVEVFVEDHTVAVVAPPAVSWEPVSPQV